jgi:hypothetical protein
MDLRVEDAKLCCLPCLIDGVFHDPNVCFRWLSVHGPIETGSCGHFHEVMAYDYFNIALWHGV